MISLNSNEWKTGSVQVKALDVYSLTDKLRIEVSIKPYDDATDKPLSVTLSVLDATALRDYLNLILGA